jgi:thioredoxin reductase (NADPH)
MGSRSKDLKTQPRSGGIDLMDDHFYDALVIGGGPAGLTAALYLARARYRVLVIEKEHFGGQVTITTEVVNYPGVERGSGEEITAHMRRQAQSFGAEFLLSTVEDIDIMGDLKKVKTQRGLFESFGLVIATGAVPRSVGFRGEAEFKGRGVAYCAACDGEFYTGLDVFVVGGGYSAAEESVFLSRYAREVTILVRESGFSCARAVVDKARANPKIKILYDTELEEVSGDSVLRYARIKNRLSGETWEYRPAGGRTFGVFVFAGYEPATDLVKGKVDLDKAGYIITDINRHTNVAGVYAAGDVCVKNLRQMVTAVGDGALAATELEKHAAVMQQATGRVPQQPVTRLPQISEPPRKETPPPEDIGPPRLGQAGIPSPGRADPPQPEPAGDQGSGGFFSADIRAQLAALFLKMEGSLVLRTFLDDRPVSEELRVFLEDLAGMSADKLSVEFVSPKGQESGLPCISIYGADGRDRNIAFYGVPGGHEFNAFIIGLYNAAGPGQTIDPALLARIRDLRKPMAMKILVSLSCRMCPELVMSAQRIALENPLIRADVYDLNHFPELRNTYKIMSVPCLVLDPGTLSFGKKNIPQLLDLLEAPAS